MSRIGNTPIEIPNGVDVNISNGTVTVKGPKGELSRSLPEELQYDLNDGVLQVKRSTDEQEIRALHGLTRSLINNMVVGVTQGYRKDLEISGVGYRAAKDGENLVLTVGFSHPVRVNPPKGITYGVESPTRINVQGIDKQMVGEQAAVIRSVRKPEPYKGKGIRYAGEVIRRKAGKAGKAGGRK